MEHCIPVTRRPPGPDSAQGWLSPKEVAERYGYAEQTLANWRSQGRGPKWTKRGEVGKPGGFVYYLPADVEAYLKENTVTVTPAA